jgi:hypothetical protein
MSGGQQPVAWEAVNKYGIIELFLDEDNAKEWAEQEGRVMPLSYTHIAASERIFRLEQALDGLVKKHIKRGPWHKPLPASEQSQEINAAVIALNLSTPQPNVDEGDA